MQCTRTGWFWSKFLHSIMANDFSLMNFLKAFHREDVQLERINRSYMVLLPKKPM